MNEAIRLATKAQALAVRQYLETLGVQLTHVQALEVIARGAGMRSRHLLAAQDSPQPQAAVVPAAPSQDAAGAYFTRVCYAYIDGSNCKRFSSMVFNGRLQRDQLRLIARRLDEGEFFVPAQVGFESLLHAFTDEGGDDHYWHRIELDEEEDWMLDAEGYVLSAGDVAQFSAGNAGDFATDADCDNLFWRFARVLEWDVSLQEQTMSRGSYRRPEVEVEDEDGERMALVQAWRWLGGLANVPTELLGTLAVRLLDDGFKPLPGNALEMRRELAPNAYQFCILRSKESGEGLVLDFDVSTLSGVYLTWAAVLPVHVESAQEAFNELSRQLHEQQTKSRTLASAYDAYFE